MQFSPFPRSDPCITIPSTIIISALTSKLLGNSKFSQLHRVFLVFFYQMDFSHDFLRWNSPFSVNLVFYAITSFSMTKIEKYLRTKWYFTYTYQISSKSVWKMEIRPSFSQSQIQIGDFTQNGERCDSKSYQPIFLKFILYLPLA